ncbi:mannose-1-phosphate guanylyltransferase [Luteipulveratus sp. YIM 133132]|uniref:Mannose-1-phosphate guanylyltransferase n=1 Tax=Luteipulveratus flavus TaxID=3031728 RepID=A0ABT6C739_9MICO|nr:MULTISPECIES: mannose-1-phosphate guanylyltransferase [unclassified Luteipulveratus]MDE9367095.1 mannose-1-phosphate guanylyltransferase [Luteipulveratus sp. YIM 133132]MDF8263081.1 mannose-1-phosphate guanylyltransferase [Luteipulveratus sp. YIM 133296]
MSEAGEEIEGFWAVVPAGGSGTRLWPLSRAGSPKFLYDLTGTGRSLLQGTVDRLAPLAGDRLMVVTGGMHAEAAREQLPQLGQDDLIVEPSPRDSMPAIGLAAAILERRDPQAVLGSFAADHVIRDDEGFRDCVRQAVAVARTGKLVTLGIKPTHASTGFGYIQIGQELDIAGAPDAHGVRAFVEKPDGVTAQRYLDSGEYRWNAGMFVVGAADLLDMLARYQPVMANYLRSIAANPLRLNELWPRLTKIAIDPAIAEPAAVDGRVAVVPGSFDWDDVGDYASLASLVLESQDAPGVKVLGESRLVVMQDATGFVAPQSGRTVVALGLDDLVVVDTEDAVLVTTSIHAQDVKKIVERLKLSGREYLT